MIKPNLNTILYIAIAVLLTVLVMTMFRKSPPNEKLIRNEIKLEALEDKRKSDSLHFEERIKEKDELITILKDKDTVLSIKYIQGNEKIKNIPATVNSLDRENLRAAVKGYTLPTN